MFFDYKFSFCFHSFFQIRGLKVPGHGEWPFFDTHLKVLNQERETTLLTTYYGWTKQRGTTLLVRWSESLKETKKSKWEACEQ